MKYFLPLCIALALPMSANAADCKPNTILPSTPNDQFVDNEDNTILDLRTGLLWAKCAIGQDYANGKCEGAAQNFTSFRAALSHVDSIRTSYLDTGGWRIPNIKELDSIVERQCTNPSINVDIFPDTPSATFFSSTPQPDSLDNFWARSISFFTGEEYTPPTETLRHVRLVKDSR